MRPDDAEGTSVAVGPGDSGGPSVAADDSDVVAGTLDDAASSGPIEVGGDVFEVDSESSPHPAARAKRGAVTAPIAASLAPSFPIRVSLSTSTRPSTASTRSARPRPRLTKTVSAATVVGQCGRRLHPVPPRYNMASSTGHLRVPTTVESTPHDRPSSRHAAIDHRTPSSRLPHPVRLGLGNVTHSTSTRAGPARRRWRRDRHD